MALVVQSRFAGLTIEDDDYPPSVESEKPKKPKTNTAKKEKVEPPKKTKNNGNNNTTKSQSAGRKKKVKQWEVSENQWELWKQKDEEIVDGNYEYELQQAIYLSKLDYEEKKAAYEQSTEEEEMRRKMAELENTRAYTKKNKKRNVMSLDQFNEMFSLADEDRAYLDNTGGRASKIIDKDTEFFERVTRETKNELIKDKINERLRNTKTAEGHINRIQFDHVIQKKNDEIALLQEEVASLKQELHTVKTRNKKLCSILGQGEMKDKAEVLVEVERLRAVQSELTAEISVLHTDLERERSRNTEPRGKDKKKKNASGDGDK